MSSITSYKTTAFKESQKFFVIDPSTQSPSLVLGSDLVSYITPMLNYVRAQSTRLAAENTDYDVGTLVQTSGATSPGDNLASTYLVVEGGTGDFPMLNGNDLLVIAGDDDLRAQLISNAAGEGSDLVAHTGTSDTVTEALDKRTIYVDGVAELEALSLPEGTSVEIVGGIRAGGGSIKTGTPPSDPSKGVYIVIANGNYWERDIDGPWNPGWFGIDPSATDNAPAWADMLSLDPPHVHYSKAGRYKFLSSVEHTEDISITGNSSVIIDCTDAGFTGNYWTRVAGSATQIEELGSNAGIGDRSLTFVSAPSVVENDLIFIYNPADDGAGGIDTSKLWSKFRNSYKEGEFCRVVSVSGSTATIAGDLYDGYLASDVDIYKVDSKTVNFGGGMRIEGDVSSGLLELEFCRNGYINNPNMFHKNNSCILLKRCFNLIVNDPAIHNVGDGGDDYGISISNCQSVKVFGGDIYSRRHSIATGGDSEIGSFTCRDIRIEGATLSNDPNSGVHNADFHGNTEDSSYENCEIYGGATFQGKNNGYVNCRIGSISVGVCILSAEILGGNHYARNCSLRTIIDPSSSSRAIVDTGGNSSAVNSNTVDNLSFELTNCKVFGRNLSASTSIANVKNRGATVKINYIIDGIELNVNDIGQVLQMELVSGTASSEFIVVDNVTQVNGLTGKKLVLHSGSSAYLSLPHKLQRQAGQQTVTSSTSSSSVLGTPVVFNWQYPRTPNVTTSRNNRGYLGNRIGIAYASGLSGSGLTPAISTDDATNFSSATTVELHWQAEISEV